MEQLGIRGTGDPPQEKGKGVPGMALKHGPQETAEKTARDQGAKNGPRG